MDVIVVGPKGWVERKSALERRMHANVYGFFRKWWAGVSYFHRDGRRYVVTAVVPVRPLGPAARVLASTIYNPRVEFTLQYDNGTPYEPDELRRAIEHAIDEDDDVLTQFHERGEILAHLSSAASFDDVLAVVQLAETAGDDA